MWPTTTEIAEWEKYYYAGSVRLAMREDSDNPLYLIGDHLGSTSLVVDTSIQGVAKRTYLPFGDSLSSIMSHQAYARVRENPAPGVSVQTELPTDYNYTGQCEATEVGLKYYVARWYDNEIGHFIQADTIIPQAGNPIGWNRYAYVNHNPLKYTDPSGHLANIVVGALIGGFVGGFTYAITNHGESFSWGELALATGLGAGAGALIASGVGLALAATAGSSLGSAMTGAGAAMIVANEYYMFDNTNDFEADEFFFNGLISVVSGGITVTPGLGSGAIIATEAISSSCSYLIIEDDPTLQGVFWSAASGAIGGALNVTANLLVEWNTRHFHMKVHGILDEAYSANISTVKNAINEVKVNSETVSAITSGVITAFTTRNYLSLGELFE